MLRSAVSTIDALYIYVLLTVLIYLLSLNGWFVTINAVRKPCAAEKQKQKRRIKASLGKTKLTIITEDNYCFRSAYM